MVHLILLAFAFVFFCLAAVGINYPPRVQFGWLGAAVLTAALFFTSR
jgi:hypothetical protein